MLHKLDIERFRCFEWETNQSNQALSRAGFSNSCGRHHLACIYKDKQNKKLQNYDMQDEIEKFLFW